uniref:phage tail tape measure protein n=1 Tax=uncultured Bilophila sp. TaxID=529385 RepID=UPI0025DD7AE6|nr:phage tail tape measure protein [uncultured Bilophila sp.]
MASEFGVSFSLGANLDGSFGSAFRSANGQIAKVTQSIRAMEGTPVGKIGASLIAQREKTQKLVGSLKEAKGQLAGYWAEAERTGDITGTLAAQIERAERKVASLKGRLYQSNAAFREQNAEAVKVSGSVTKLRHDYDALNAAMNRAKSHRDALSANIARKNELRDQRSDLNGRLLGGAAQAATAAIPLRLAVSAEDTFADLKKVMNGADDELLGQVYQDALKMSSETGKSFEDVVTIMTAGAQAGLGKTREEMRSNTEQAIQMSVAWGVSAEQAGGSLATWRSSMGMTNQEARHTADVINALSNEMKGEAGELDRIFTRMGPLMKGSGLALQDIAALGMAFKASGSDVNVAGTAMKNFSKVLSLGNAMTKDQKEIFSRLGLDPKAMQKQMQTDAKGAIMTLLKQLKRVPREMQNAVSMKLFGDESIDAIAPLLENLGLLDQAFKIANSNVDGSILDEYKSRMETTATEEAKLAQQTRNLGITVGNAALPAYNAFLKTMSKGVGVITEFAKKYPNVTTALLGGVGALAALTVGGIVFGYAYNGLATTMNAVKGGMLALRGATIANTGATRAGTLAVLWNRAAHLSWADVGKGSVGTVKSLGSGMLSLIGIQKGTAIGSVWAGRGLNVLRGAAKLLKVGLGALKFAFGPVGIAIAVIGGAAYWLIENWDVVGPYFSKAWDWICGKFKWAADFIKGIVDWVFKAVDTIAKKWTESETFKRNTADALSMNFGNREDSTAEDGAAWVRTGNEKGKEPLESPPDFVGPKPQDKAPDKPAGPKPLETAKPLPGMPTGDAPGGFDDGSLPAPDFSGWGDEDGKKKKGRKGKKGPGPVTVVSLDSGNTFHTVFIPAASKGDKPSSKPVGASVLAPSSSGGSETVAFSKAGQNLVGGLNKTFDRLPKLFDASLSKVSEPDIPPAVVNIPASSSSPQPAPRAIFHPVQRQDRSGSPFAVLKNALSAAPDQWSRTINAKLERSAVPPAFPPVRERDTLPPVLPQTPMLLERNKKAPTQRQPEASGDIQIVQHFNIADAGNLPTLKKELRRLEPEFEKLVRRALDKMRSDKARTAHAQ